MPSSQITFRGQLICSVGQPKQVQPANPFMKSVNLDFLIGRLKTFRGRPIVFYELGLNVLIKISN